VSNPNHLVCVPCRRFFHRLENGVTIEEGMPSSQPGEWQGYKLWAADLFKCEGCGAEIVAGFAQSPMAEHYQERYAHLQPSARFRVDDCPGGPYKVRDPHSIVAGGSHA